MILDTYKSDVHPADTGIDGQTPVDERAGRRLARAIQIPICPETLDAAGRRPIHTGRSLGKADVRLVRQAVGRYSTAPRRDQWLSPSRW
jgi:hypothetical protein